MTNHDTSLQVINMKNNTPSNKSIIVHYIYIIPLNMKDNIPNNKSIIVHHLYVRSLSLCIYMYMTSIWKWEYMSAVGPYFYYRLLFKMMYAAGEYFVALVYCWLFYYRLLFFFFFFWERERKKKIYIYIWRWIFVGICLTEARLCSIGHCIILLKTCVAVLFFTLVCFVTLMSNLMFCLHVLSPQLVL